MKLLIFSINTHAELIEVQDIIINILRSKSKTIISKYQKNIIVYTFNIIVNTFNIIVYKLSGTWRSVHLAIVPIQNKCVD